MNQFLREMRPKHWVKNVFVFIPLFFSGELLSPELLLRSLFAFVAFCLASSAVYVFNDIQDRTLDALDPKKVGRPIASGAITVRAGYIQAALCLLAALGAAILIDGVLVAIVLVYVAVNILYSLYLKHVPIIDVVCLSSGYLLRLYAGSVATGIFVSWWMFLVIFAMAMFMGFGKRQGEHSVVGVNGSHGSVLSLYPPGFLRQATLMSALLIVVFYSLWAIAEVELKRTGEYFVFTVPLVFLVVLLYLYILGKPEEDGDPTSILLSSHPLQISLVAYAGMMYVLLYWL